MIKTQVYIRDGKLVKRIRPGHYGEIDADEIASLAAVVAESTASTTQGAAVKTLLNAIRSQLVGDTLDGEVTLAIGSSKANVANAAFDFHINGKEYKKAAVTAGTALAGDNIPQSLYGAFALDIGADKTVDLIPAAANATGYASAILALAGIPAAAANHVRMGTVSVIKVDAAFLVSAPTLAIGSTPANLAHAEFTYNIAQTPYTEPALAAGIALPAQTCPQNKYAAYRLQIGADETLDIVPAANNGTSGYDSAVLALAGIPAVEAGHVVVGTLTAVSSDAGGFVAATTSLADGAVTAVYTDGALDGFFIPGTTELDDAEVTAAYADGAVGTAAIGAAIA